MFGFNGAGMFPSQKFSPGLFYPEIYVPLQWGRDVSIPEIQLQAGLERGHLELQWGRDVSIPEMARRPGRPVQQAGFNGAGMFPSQK